MKTYLTETGHPVKTNNPQKEWKEISKEEYEFKVKELNDKADVEKLNQEKDQKRISDQRIQDEVDLFTTLIDAAFPAQKGKDMKHLKSLETVQGRDSIRFKDENAEFVKVYRLKRTLETKYKVNII